MPLGMCYLYLDCHVEVRLAGYSCETGHKRFFSPPQDFKRWTVLKGRSSFVGRRRPIRIGTSTIRTIPRIRSSSRIGCTEWRTPSSRVTHMLTLERERNPSSSTDEVCSNRYVWRKYLLFILHPCYLCSLKKKVFHHRFYFVACPSCSISLIRWAIKDTVLTSQLDAGSTREYKKLQKVTRVLGWDFLIDSMVS
jgi:hypothetical protein